MKTHENLPVSFAGGNTFVGEHPDVCPICGVPHSKFSEVQ